MDYVEDITLSLLCTHNNTQNKMSRCHPTPSSFTLIFMWPSTIDPNRSAVAPDDFTVGAPRPGSCALRRIPSFGTPKSNPSKN